MRNLGLIWLAASWAVWLFPFIWVRRRGGRPAEITVRASNWGLLLECAAIGLAWLGTAREVAAWRMALLVLLTPAAIVFAWLAVLHLGKQLRIQAGLYSDHELVRSGPYSLVRHPIYASLFGMMLATALLRASGLVLALAVALYVIGTEIRIRLEERLLESRFGPEFREYRARVPAYIPFLR